MVGMATSPTSSLDILSEVGVVEDQSHLTRVVVGVPPEEREEGEEGEGEEGGGGLAMGVSLVTEEEPDDILRQVNSVLNHTLLIRMS